MIKGALVTLIFLHDSIFRLRDNSRIPNSAEIESGKKYKKCREDETVLSPLLLLIASLKGEVGILSHDR